MKITKEQIENARKILAKYETENGDVAVSYTPQGTTNCAGCAPYCASCCAGDCVGGCVGSCRNSCAGSAS